MELFCGSTAPDLLFTRFPTSFDMKVFQLLPEHQIHTGEVLLKKSSSAIKTFFVLVVCHLRIQFLECTGALVSTGYS